MYKRQLWCTGYYGMYCAFVKPSFSFSCEVFIVSYKVIHALSNSFCFHQSMFHFFICHIFTCKLSSQVVYPYYLFYYSVIFTSLHTRWVKSSTRSTLGPYQMLSRGESDKLKLAFIIVHVQRLGMTHRQVGSVVWLSEMPRQYTYQLDMSYHAPQESLHTTLYGSILYVTAIFCLPHNGVQLLALITSIYIAYLRLANIKARTE